MQFSLSILSNLLNPLMLRQVALFSALFVGVLFTLKLIINWQQRYTFQSSDSEWSNLINKHVWSLAIISMTLILYCSIVILIIPPKLITPSLPAFDPIPINLHRPLYLEFDRPITPDLKASITPEIEGSWVYQSRRYIFLPDRLLFIPKEIPQPNTEYTINLENVLPLVWLNRSNSENYLFVISTPSDATSSDHQQKSQLDTQPSPTIPSPSQAPMVLEASPSAEVIMPSLTPTSTPTSFNLEVPLFKQHYTFTCYSTAAKMTLGFRGVTIQEVGFLDEIGYDTTARDYLTNTWGDPNQGVVGHYNGGGQGGYGAHWDPVAKAINKYRPTEVKRQWNLSELLTTVEAGNPVMVWWVNGVWPAKDTSWKNSQGESVYTVNGMHVEVVTGWIGDRSNPTYILTNDPWRGKRRYTPSTFTNLWKWFDNTAVIVY